MRRAALVTLVLLAATSGPAAQDAPSFVPFEALATDLRALPPTPDAATRRAEIAAILREQTQELALYALGAAVYGSLVEAQRIDKQLGTSGATAGSTSLVSRGSVPALIGAAVESGALYQSVSGSLVTLRANPSGLARALAHRTYWLAGPSLDAAALERVFERLSVSASFDLTLGDSPGTFTGDQSQLREATLRVDVMNRRDPRHASHAAVIRRLGGEMASVVGTMEAYFKVLSGLPAYGQWLVSAADALAEVPADDDRALHAALVRTGNDFIGRFGAHPELRRLGGVLVEEIRAYRTVRDSVSRAIARSSTLAVEYAFNRLALSDDIRTALPDGATVPDTSTGRVIFSSPLGDDAEAVVNASAAFFNATPPQLRGSLRDVQVGASVDVRLPEIESLGRLTLTLAALGAYLHQQPFGAPVAIHGVETGTGWIRVFQGKVTIPTGASGVRIPISLTHANRSEFNTEATVRGAVGLTLDVDALFAR